MIEIKESEAVTPLESTDFDKTCLWNLKSVLKGIPKPYYLSSLFADQEPFAICRPLFPPFDDFAITHFGQVFLAHPLLTWNYAKELTLLDPISLVFPEHRGHSNDNYKGKRQIVRLQDKSGRIRKTFFVDRLVLERFFGVPLTDKVEISYVDEDYSRPSIDNLEAFLVNKNEVIPPVPQDWADVQPLH